jgi:hypothetical protein
LNNHEPPVRDRRKRLLLRRLTALLFAGMIDMDFGSVRRHVILIVVLAFGLVDLCIWWSEILDLPHRFFGEPAEPVHWQAAAAQTVCLALLLGFVVIVIRVFFKQIHYLEGFLPVCSFCKSIRVGDKWVPLERYLQEHTTVKMTHSLCSGCAKQYYDYDVNEEQPPPVEREGRHGHGG